MILKQRATAAEDKEVRRQALLDAAEKLFLQRPDGMASVEQVARAAGVAKGTVYLYFPGKEEMLLALHERHVATFFAALRGVLAAGGRVGFDEIWAVTRDHLVRAPGCLPLTGRCLGLLEREVPRDTAIAFKARMGEALAQGGAGLERHFPRLAPGEGITLLLHCYGLIVGLWQLMHPNERLGLAAERADLALFRRDYETEVERALRTVWRGTLGEAAADRPAPKRRKP